MFNYRVQNIEALVKNLKENGVTVVDTIETFEYGKFVYNSEFSIQNFCCFHFHSQVLNDKVLPVGRVFPHIEFKQGFDG